MGMCLSPVLGIAREPRWGRTEETLGEDTYLASRMAVGYVSRREKERNCFGFGLGEER